MKLRYFGLFLAVLFLIGCTQSPGGNISGNAILSLESTEVVEEPKEEVKVVEEIAPEEVLVNEEVEEEPTEVIESGEVDFLKSLEEAKKTLDDNQEEISKLNECTRLCVGDNYDILFYRNKWYNTCYEIYYYSGMEGLDKQIADCKD